MKKWIANHLLVAATWLRAESIPVEDRKEAALDTYSDEQIRFLLYMCAVYKRAKKDPEAFVEEFFGKQIAPETPFKDSWLKGSKFDGLSLSWDEGLVR